VATLNQPIKSGLGYGPIETIIHNVDKGLHALGHRSIVACSADSRVTGEHYVTVDKGVGGYCRDQTPDRRLTLSRHLSRALERAAMGDIDVVHMHDADAVEFFYASMRNLHIPIVLTLHVSAQDSGLADAYQRWCNPVSSATVTCTAISEHQQRQYQHLVRNARVVHHGIDVDSYPAEDKHEGGKYLFTIGRITRDKGQDKAIELAKRTGCKLIIAGCVQNKAADREFFASIKQSIDLTVALDQSPVDRHYYERVIKPLIDCDKQIIYIGELSGEHKAQWYRHARATVFPIQWDEPFGLVLIESMACGTPVIAFDKGAVPELVVQGKTGFVVDSMSAMTGAVGWVDALDPDECRNHVRRHFSIAKMASAYSALYRQLVHAHQFDSAFSPVSNWGSRAAAPLLKFPT
jgi:glycosyltransferase involved in cell wall biosynthesis